MARVQQVGAAARSPEKRPALPGSVAPHQPSNLALANAGIISFRHDLLADRTLGPPSYLAVVPASWANWKEFLSGMGWGFDPAGQFLGGNFRVADHTPGTWR